jgi:hypothetical protein
MNTMHYFHNPFPLKSHLVLLFLIVKEEWKQVAQNLGVSRENIEFYESKEKDHAKIMLQENCSEITVIELYDVLVKSGANAIADYL